MTGNISFLFNTAINSIYKNTANIIRVQCVSEQKCVIEHGTVGRRKVSLRVLFFKLMQNRKVV
jgi:hypothetical protein